MSVEPKIHKNEDLRKLEACYVDEKMSTVDIEKNSKSIFGFYVSRGTIYKTLNKHNMSIRNKSISISRAKSTLDIDKSLLDGNIVEWIDGFNLGDGCIQFSHTSPRFAIASSTKNWASYSMEGLSVYNPSEPKCYQKIDKKHPNHIWDSRTKSHPDIKSQAQRWYPNGKKQIPDDICITPTSVMLWYLGDGTLVTNKNTNATVVSLATCSFKPERIKNLLMKKLKDFGIASSLNTENKVVISGISVRHFFNLIGHKSPVPEYQYKFEYPKWLDLIRLSEIVKNNKEKYRAQYYYKMGQVECSKSPGGKMLLFTEEQAEKLKNKLG